MNKENGAQIGLEAGERRFTRRQFLIRFIGIMAGIEAVSIGLGGYVNWQTKRRLAKRKETGGFKIEKDGQEETIKVITSVSPTDDTEMLIKGALQAKRDGCKVQDVKVIGQTEATILCEN